MTKLEVIKKLEETKEIINFNEKLLMPVLKYWDKYYLGKLQFFVFGSTVHMKRTTALKPISKLKCN
jgi:hypothetical protein